MAGRLVVVANRLPVKRTPTGWVTSSGGLVTALVPVLRDHAGIWIGWSGVADRPPDEFDAEGVQCLAVPLTRDEVDNYYLGFCNESIWPLYHDAIRTPRYRRGWWTSFTEVNQRYARAALEVASDRDVFWIHDYHMQLVPGFIRGELPGADIRFFLHIPFPPIELFSRLPWRQEVIEGLLGSDVVGFQTEHSARNFMNAATAFGGATRSGDVLVSDERATRVVTAPISIEAAEFERIARRESTAKRAEELRRELGNPHAMLLGVDRLDYTKGIEVRLRAFETMLEPLPVLGEALVFVQIAVPSRESIGDYATMRQEIERIAGHINGMYGRRHQPPVHYVYDSLEREELVAYYRAADVMVVTPLADGMNLVAKEFVASRVDDRGVLVLSEFAGAAQELNGAVLVNPYHIDGLANEMMRATVMDPGEVQSRMGRMREVVRTNDIRHWTEVLVGDVFAT